MTDYSNQDISGLDLTGQNLTGVDFTNAIATNVIFTNAIITNAIFKNTLITGATLTGITFSDLQKGHLLLRAANHTNTAVNNLTSLTSAEFRIIQPAVSTDTIARISTVTVKIPNSQGEGYTMPATPLINQLICIFVATNQNIIITTGGTQIRTIRSNGTVVQDVTNGNTTLNYLKIDSISYRLTVGNGDGVIAMIPVDLNVYQVNGSGLGDIVSLNLGSASTTLNMNNNAITNVSSIQGWNVKEITAGTGVGVTATNGSYAISNTAVVRDISAGTGISVSTTNGVATISNSAVVRDISAGTGITVSTISGVATITNTGPTQAAVAQTIRDENQALVEVGALPRKPDYWATNWVVADNTARNHNDMYVSVDGKIIASASPVNASTGSIRYSTDYGATFGNGNVSLNWQTICGTSQGSRLFAISSTFGTPSSTTLYQSINQGATWTQITSPGFASDAYISRMRCSGDGTYLTATDLNTSYNGRYYTSSNSGTTWTARTLSASAGYTNSLCFSRSGSIQYITWIASGNTSSVIYRSFDYGVTFTLVQGHIADGGYWRRIECDATGRFVYVTRFNTITSQLYVYRSDDYGTTWTQFNSPGYEDVWVSATGQFVVIITNAWTWNIAPYNGIIVAYSRDYGRQDTFGLFSLGQTSTIQTINGSGDGSVLVLGSLSVAQSGFAGDGKIRVARQGQQNIQDLSVVGGTISKASGTYTLTNDVVLWFSGAIDITTQTSRIALPFTSAGKIDLANYHIKYEIDINWNLETTVGSPSHPFCYISMGFYGDYTTNSNVAANKSVRAATTIWTMKTNNTTGSFPLNIASTTNDQMFNNVFLCGYAPGQGSGDAYRYRTMMKGEISRATSRPAQYSGDFAPNSRLVMNRFYSDAVLYDNDAGTNALEFYNPTEEGHGQHHIQGTAVWEMNRENKYSVIQNGVDGLLIDLNNTASSFAAVPRRGYITYRIYRVRK
jgi:hypothetical protein